MKDLLGQVSEKMIKEAINKRMKLFFVLLATASIPDGKYASRRMIKSMINAISPVRRFLDASTFASARQNGYLETKHGAQHGKVEIYGYVLSTDQAFDRITPTGKDRLKQYIDDFNAEFEIAKSENHPSFPAKDQPEINPNILHDILIEFLTAMGVATRKAGEKLQQL